MQRQIAGRILFIGGGVIVAFTGARYVSGAVAQDRARREWEGRAAHAAMSLAWETSTRVRVSQTVTDGGPVARLIIPKIGLDDIVLEGVGSGVLNGGPGHYPGSPLPGNRGNAIISAHRDRHFRRLGELAIGDTVRTESDSRIATWVITSRRVLDKGAAALFPASVPVLTLTTCWPIEYLGSAPDRLILTARLAGRQKG